MKRGKTSYRFQFINCKLQTQFINCKLQTTKYNLLIIDYRLQSII